MAECKHGAGSAFERNSRYLLIVDSDANDIYTVLLQRFEYNICTARNADEAMEMVSVALPTLIISELSLTGRNGIELLQQLKENPRTAPVPVVIEAEDPSPEVERKCLQAGAALIRKPVQARLQTSSSYDRVPAKNIRIHTRRP
jgi:CheY-like chemotaxis protein